MASIIVPAFLEATFFFFFLPSTQHTVPLLNQNQTILTINPSSDLFTFPILAAHEKMVNIGAKVIMVDP